MTLTACDGPLAGFVVTDIWFSGGIRLIACKHSGGGGKPLEANTWFGGPLTFRDKSGKVNNLDDGGTWERLIALFELRHQVFESAVADGASQIQICFELGKVPAAGAHAQWVNGGPLDGDVLGNWGIGIGNFRQAFTHPALIAAALNLDRQLDNRASGPARARPTGS